MKKFRDITFRAKIQTTLFAVAVIATLMVVNNLINFYTITSINEALNTKIIVSRDHLSQLKTEFQDLQLNLLKFSITGFEDQFNTNFKRVEKDKQKILEVMNILRDSTMREIFENNSKDLDGILNEYFGLVVDGTLSAAAMKDFEMASYIATSSGEELSKKFNDQLNEVTSNIEKLKSEYEEQAQMTMSRALIGMIAGMIIGTLVFLISFFKIIPTMTKPVSKFKELLHEYSLGNFTGTMECKNNDEFGQMTNMLNKLRESQLEKISAAEKIAAGDLEVKLHSLSENDLLSESFEKMLDNLQKLVLEINQLTDESIKGNSSARGSTETLQGGYKKIIEGMNGTLDAVYDPINEAVRALEKIAAGDLTVEITKNYQGDHQRIKNSINHASESLSKTLKEVSKVVSAAVNSADEINSSTEEMAAGAQEQSAQAGEVAIAVEEMSKTIFETTRNTTEAAEVSRNAGTTARDGGKVVEESIARMGRIVEVVSKSSATVIELGKSSNEIGEIIKVIDDIADQTNLLALNAAIEAARAGEQGRGFAVVADEVRKLAERTTKATKEIAGMIKRIQTDTADAVESMKLGTEEVIHGKQLAEKAGSSLKQIITGAENVADIVSQVAAASEQQSRTSEQISQSIELITNVTQQSAVGVSQIAHAVENLNDLTNNLQKLIQNFKLDEVFIREQNINYRTVMPVE
ncbi:MAG: hypothetical protein IPH11_14095 [Ignavibacteriales bacterium]|nr:hypothetical protein [Ignavibacteriales bacterium]